MLQHQDFLVLKQGNNFLENVHQEITENKWVGKQKVTENILDRIKLKKFVNRLQAEI